MASERGRVIAIFGVIALLGAGAGYYFFKIYQPAQQKKDAQAEIEAWELRWKAARDCLMGPTPASTKTSEALAIREMSPDPWNRGGCTPLISKLSRGDAPDTGLKAVEDAWTQLDKAASKAASAFATHIADTTSMLAKDPLPAALDALDAARANLRSAAGLPPTAQAGAPLPAAQVIPLVDGKDPVTALDLDEVGLTGTSAVPSAHGFVVFGKTASREVQVSLPVGAAPVVGKVGPGALRAVPDGSWGAAAGQGQVKIGGMDAEGAMPSPTTLPLPGSTQVVVAAAAGTMNDGVVVYGGNRELAIAHAHAGAITADSPLPMQTALAGVDLDGRVALAWTTADREHHARLLRPGGDEPKVELTDVVLPGTTAAAKLARPMMSSSPCLTNDRAYLVFGGSKIVGFGNAGGAPAELAPPAGEAAIKLDMMGCTPDALVLRDVLAADGMQAGGYIVCTDTCAALEFPEGAPHGAAFTVVGGKLVAMVTHGAILAVWRGPGKPAFYGLPEAAIPFVAHGEPVMAATDGKVIDLLARGANGIVVIRLPAS